jgi:hypothetical protein
MTQTRFEAGKGIAHRKMEIQNTMASVTRRFKAGEVVDISDIDLIIEHAQEVKKTVEHWNDVRRRELGQIVRTA